MCALESMATVVDEKTPLISKIPESPEPAEKQDGRSSCTNFARFLSSVRLEPSIVFFGITNGMEAVFGTNFIIDKVCKASYSPDKCENLDSGLYPREQDSVQRLSSAYGVYIRLIEFIPGIVVMLFLGSWGDHRERKGPILLPLAGNLLKGLLLTANAYWWSLPPEYILVAYIPVGLTGSMLSLLSGAYAYISTASAGKSRTSRVAVIGVIVHFTSPAGQALAEALFDRGGYLAVFGAHSAAGALALVYSGVRLEKWPEGRKQGDLSASVWQALSPKAVMDMFFVALRRRKNGVRGYILGYVAAVSLYVVGVEAKLFDFLYCRKRFGWDHSTFTLFSIIDMPLRATGSLLVLPLLSYFFRVDDGILAFIGGTSTLFLFIVRGTAPQAWVMYLSSVIGLGNEMVSVSSRAALSKLVKPEELGAIFAILSTGEALIPIIAPSIFTAIYNSTIDFFPGLVYIFAASFSCGILFILTWILTRRANNGLYREVSPFKKQ
ncbi:lysosomal proton-coupled steroid conjugate and bile acid symporter SLC46A3-like [Macrobrachium rosenbergii]|uniref:lysosomal proton-coupled steroid conjugate and bile acid symporter SLC46A3-like n=1 Tax=Macrobrachium rosenbergii TaxID=79674 RepID=UPI0034D78199